MYVHACSEHPTMCVSAYTYLWQFSFAIDNMTWALYIGIIVTLFGIIICALYDRVSIIIQVLGGGIV